jgi:hypothetical protein
MIKNKKLFVEVVIDKIIGVTGLSVDELNVIDI